MYDRTLRSSLKSVRKCRLNPRVTIPKLNIPDEILTRHKIDNFMSIAKTGVELKVRIPKFRTPEQFMNEVDQFINILEKDRVVFPDFMLDKQKPINVAFRDVKIAVNLFKRQMIKAIGKFNTTALFKREIERRRKVNPPFLGIDNSGVTNVISVDRSDGQNKVDTFSENTKMWPDKSCINSHHTVSHDDELKREQLINSKLIALNIIPPDKIVPPMCITEHNPTPRMDLKHRILSRVRNSDFYDGEDKNSLINKNTQTEPNNGDSFYVVSGLKRVEKPLS